MKYTLKPFQAQAVGELLTALEQAQSLTVALPPQNASVALTAPTGAGKTVIAAALIEALFFGSDRFDFAADPGAVVIWFSDDPNLNEQSRYRLMQASEKLSLDRLVHIRPPFPLRQLKPRTVYFLNTQRLSRNSLLTRGYDGGGESGELEGFKEAAPPDGIAWTIWEILDNTIKDGNLNVYFVLDEAHRGFDSKGTVERATIVRRLVSGDTTRAAMPVVVGISATIGRFKQAMEAADASGSRVALTDVTVDPAQVQASGLLKDTILLDIPAEIGEFGTTLVAEGARRLHESAMRWRRYAARQQGAPAVVPLLVFQIPNTPDADAVGKALDAMQDVLHDLSGDSVRHVLGSGKPETFGRWEVDWIEPERVQEATHVRVLVAKEAISTGWDCPRAEVMVSLRPAKDQTHIAQLIGRMVRNPLADRIVGEDRLNSVDCILPYFDKTTAGHVVRYLTGQQEGLPLVGVSRVLLDGREMAINAKVDADVWTAFDAMPTQTVPQRGSRPVKRLVALAHALAVDGLRRDALAEVTASLHSWLDAYAAEYAAAVADAEEEVLVFHVQRLKGTRGTAGVRYEMRHISADDQAIRAAFEEAKRVFGADVAQRYVAHLTSSDDDGLRAAYVRTAALATVSPLRQRTDQDADALADAWFSQHALEILELTDERQQEYEAIRALATTPRLGTLRRPKSRLEDFSMVSESGQPTAAPLAQGHLMADADGNFPIGALNGWEREVVEHELARSEGVGWYRNPSVNSLDSLTVAYRDSIGDWRSMHPDFVFFARRDGEVLPSLVDPHRQDLDDALAKLRGLAQFAEKYGDSFDRILSVIKVGAAWRALDLKLAEVRAAIHSHAGEVKGLYSLPVATEYV